MFVVLFSFFFKLSIGLEQLIAEMVPETSHRTCYRHLFNNLKKKFPGLLLKKYFWQASRAYSHLEFGYAM